MSATTSPTTSTTSRSSSCARRRTRIRAFYNVCQHRGRRLTEGCGQRAKLQCRFHGWQWDLDGKVIRIVDREDWQGCPDMSDEDFALPRGQGRHLGRLRLRQLRSRTASRSPSTWRRCPNTPTASSSRRCATAGTSRCACPATGRSRWRPSARAITSSARTRSCWTTQGDDVTRSFTFGRHGMFGYPAPARLPGAPSPRTGRPVPDDVRPGIVKFFAGPGGPAQGHHHRARQRGGQAHPRPSARPTRRTSSC